MRTQWKWAAILACLGLVFIAAFMITYLAAAGPASPSFIPTDWTSALALGLTLCLTFGALGWFYGRMLDYRRQARLDLEAERAAAEFSDEGYLLWSLPDWRLELMNSAAWRALGYHLKPEVEFGLSSLFARPGDAERIRVAVDQRLSHGSGLEEGIRLRTADGGELEVDLFWIWRWLEAPWGSFTVYFKYPRRARSAGGARVVAVAGAGPTAARVAPAPVPPRPTRLVPRRSGEGPGGGDHAGR